MKAADIGIAMGVTGTEVTKEAANLFSNAWLWSAVALSLLLQVAVVHVPFLNIAFGTAPLSFDQWLVCAAMASVVLVYSELQKLLRRRWHHEGATKAPRRRHEGATKAPE